MIHLTSAVWSKRSKLIQGQSVKVKFAGLSGQGDIVNLPAPQDHRGCKLLAPSRVTVRTCQPTQVHSVKVNLPARSFRLISLQNSASCG